MHAGMGRGCQQYILYPAERTRIREAKTSLMKSIDEITNVDARISDMKRYNANIDGNTAMGPMLQIGTAGAKAYNAAYLLTPDRARAYREGDIHIHDFDLYALTTTAARSSWSSCSKAVSPPVTATCVSRRASAAMRRWRHCHSVQPERPARRSGRAQLRLRHSAGRAQDLAKNYAGKLQEALEDVLDTDDESVLTRGHAAGTEATGEEPWLQSQAATFDAAAAQQLVKDGRLIRKRQRMWCACPSPCRESHRPCHFIQAMEGFVHNLNTMHSPCGCADAVLLHQLRHRYSPKAAWLSATSSWLRTRAWATARLPFFPIHILKRVKEGVNWATGRSQLRSVRIVRRSAPRLFPNYVFWTRPLTCSITNPAIRETEVATMAAAPA